jgi:hypothetical protein
VFIDRIADFPDGNRRTENRLRAGEAWSCEGELGSGERLAWRDCDRGVKARAAASGEREVPGGDAGCEKTLNRGDGAGDGDTECWPIMDGAMPSTWPRVGDGR